MRIGELRARLVIQTRAEVSDDAGGTSLVWAELTSIWAKPEPGRTGQSVAGESWASQGVMEFTARRSAEIEVGMRAIWSGEGRVYSITGIQPAATGYMTLACSEITMEDA